MYESVEWQLNLLSWFLGIKKATWAKLLKWCFQ
jgi:hypothetical protein